MTHINLIHLSDLHYAGTAEDDRRVKRLLHEVNNTLATTPAHICFSGDLTKSGSKDQFYHLAENFLLKLSGYSNLFMCPGNHDVWRDYTGEKIVKDAIQRVDADISIDLSSTPFGEDCPLKEYTDLQAALSDFSYNGFYVSSFACDDFHLTSLNSTWTSFGRPEGYSDKGNLHINQRPLDQVISEVKEDSTKLLMMHHPISWMNEGSQRYLRNVFLKEFDFVLSGHEHDASSMSIQSNQGETIFIEATAAKDDWSTGLNGYSIITIDTSNHAVQVKHRSYSNTREMFIDGSDVAEDGYYYPRAFDEAHWKRENSTNVKHVLENLSKQVDDSSVSRALASSYSAKFDSHTAPITSKFSKINFSEGQADSGVKTAITDCMDKVSNLAFFVGPKDSGLTTASLISYKHISKNIEKYQSIPIYVDVEDITSINKATLMREVQRGFVNHLSPTEAMTLVNAGAVFFLFDSVCIHDVSDISAIRDTLSAHFKGCRSAIFCSLDKRNSLNDGSGQVKLDPTDDVIFEVCELSASEIKDLIEKKAPEEAAATKENLLNNTIIGFKAMDEPIYATTVSLLVDTLKQLPDFKPINRVRLLDRYIECLLGRYTFEDVKVGKFNSSDKSNLLSFIAGRMIELCKVHLSRSEIDEVIKNYTEEMLLEVPKDILEECFEKGILLASGERITFRANSMFSYFVAKEMIRNPDLFSHITTKENFFSHNNEIVFYAELEGVDNSTLLKNTQQYIIDLETIIINQYEDNGINFEDEWRKLVSPSVDDAPLLEDTIDKIASQVPNEEDMMLSRSTDLHSSFRARGVSERSTIKDLEAKWLIAIRVYLQLLRHSSTVNGLDKIKHLRSALNSLERLSQSIAVKREKISSNFAYSDGGILYINPLAAIDIDKSKREFKLNANISVATMASDLMGTSQLGLALSRVSDSENEFQNFIIRNLLMDIPSSDNAQYIVQSIANSKIPTLQIASMRELKNKYVSYKTNDQERAYQKEIIEGLNKEKNIRKHLNLTDLKRRLSLQKLRNPDAFKPQDKPRKKKKRVN